jgi:hypothetical protein
MLWAVRDKQGLPTHDVFVLLVVLAAFISVGRQLENLADGRRVAEQDDRSQ